MRSYSSEGIVLARRDYGEADRILVILTRDFGKNAYIAKGIRRLSSRKRGHLEIFSYLKFSAAVGKGLDIITEAQIINNFTPVRSDLKKVTVAYYFMEVVGRVTRDEEKNVELFELILGYLGDLEKRHKLKELRSEFIYEVLVTLGFWPRGKPILNPDMVLENVVEREINSVRVGRKILS